jgi:6-pyruvoyltetrahydropterin/6-carboxytetrahydropterin synthase
MVEVEKSYSFEAGHACLQTPGACSFPHGHSYVLIVRFDLPDLQYDCGEIDRQIGRMLDQYFECKWLNDSLQLEDPSLRTITKWIFDYLKDKLPYIKACELYDSPLRKEVIWV